MKIALFALLFVLVAAESRYVQDPVLLTFAWDLDVTHDATTAWEMEVDGVPQPCVNPAVTNVDRRCNITIPRGDYTFRLRALPDGGWSNPLAGHVTAPGLFVIRSHQENEVGPSLLVPVTTTTVVAPNNAMYVEIAHDGGQGADRCLTVAVRTYASSPVSITSVTFGGIGLVRGPSAVHAFGATSELSVRAEIWSIVEPVEGTHVLAVTASANAARMSVVNTSWAGCAGVGGQTASLGGLMNVFDLPLTLQQTGSIVYGSWSGIGGRAITPVDTIELGRLGGITDTVHWTGYATLPRWQMTISSAVRSAAVVVELRAH